MVDYEKLLNLDYTVYSQVQEFEQVVEKLEIEESESVVLMDHSYDNGVPVIDLVATDVCGESYACDSYQMPEVTREEFEEVMHDIWVSCLEDITGHLRYRPSESEVVL